MTTAAPAAFDTLDTALLERVQRSIPLVSRPFAQLAEELRIGEEACINRLIDLREKRKVIRQISAIFDTKALGYRSALVAAKVAPDRLEAAADLISQHPGVSHNYERNHAFNLWYTIAVPPDSALGLEGTVDRLHALSGAETTRALPTLKLYKIGVRFKLTDTPSSVTAADNKAGVFSAADQAISAKHKIDQADKRIIRVLQQDLPLVAQPFEAWAQEAGCTIEALLDAAERYQQRRQMRRFSAVLHHRKAGVSANAMGVWNVPEDQAEAIGQQFARYDAVSHCYLRPRYADWPYNIFTMVHGRTRDEAIATLNEMQQATGIKNMMPLWSTREFKKVRVRYFTGENEAWEQDNAASLSPDKPQNRPDKEDPAHP